MQERSFQQRLSALILRYNDAFPLDGKSIDDENWDKEWDQDWEELLMDATKDQANRAALLLELHVKNRSENMSP